MQTRQRAAAYLCCCLLAGCFLGRCCLRKREAVGALSYISLWHIQQSPGTVKTVPYSLFYIALSTHKRSVGRDALIPPWRSLADCVKRELVGARSRHLARAQDRSVACTPQWGVHY